MNYKFTKREIIQQLSNKFGERGTVVVVNYILEKLNINIDFVEVESLKELKRNVSVLNSKRNEKLKLANRRNDRFEFLHKDWLNSEFKLQTIDLKKFSNLTAQGPGRSSLAFCEKSERSQRRETAFISAQYDNNPDKILHACHYAARISGETDLTIVLGISRKVQKKQLKSGNLSKMRRMRL